MTRIQFVGKIQPWVLIYVCLSHGSPSIPSKISGIEGSHYFTNCTMRGFSIKPYSKCFLFITVHKETYCETEIVRPFHNMEVVKLAIPRYPILGIGLILIHHLTRKTNTVLHLDQHQLSRHLSDCFFFLHYVLYPKLMWPLQGTMFMVPL